jgi:hypothetical protein
MHLATRIVGNDGKKITAQGLAWDLEKNLRIVKEVERSITYSNGATYNQDMQIVTANAASSIVLRNAILTIIPRALIKKVYEAAVKFAIGDQKRLAAKVEALFSRFQKRGIEKERILKYFEKNDVAEFTVDDVEEMIGIGTAIKEGSLLIDKAFVADNTVLGNSKANDLENTLKGQNENGKILNPQEEKNINEFFNT